ncbi:putative MFS transporter superfamily [Helianthus annuus]|uniref:MFS transporter superfamily n=1 Tax=Helianthus annuus TaxID=4232 RepID=A0A9K3NMZ7_HELAN|nr:putative MFS transporter superfamily [Helianthus annuus]KAJ0570531.1 putative MFS transporter superfamily [Helianthus annuus]KAJ0584878.1 putative MFS transporter superfamily [Helianthus annuus]KAJ0747449.1 putative MFS transporter superfamily [Helianthus annuus]KAJ0919301.1 putative MFS transporter superfamily [Helianthus annuus]
MFMSNIYFGFSSTALPILSLFPFLYFMVRDFNIAEKEEDISYYAYALELFRDEYQALGLSAISTSWGIGLIIGPALGGYLAQVFVHTCILIFYRYLPFIPCADNILKID